MMILSDGLTVFFSVIILLSFIFGGLVLTEEKKS